MTWLFFASLASTAATPSVTDLELAAAKKIVADAIAHAATLNKARLESPRRNKYTIAPGSIISGGGAKVKRDDLPVNETSSAPPLINVTPEIAAAAALVAEAEAAAGNISSPLVPRGTFWMESIARKGTSPWGDDSSYKIFRNVKDYGAVGDGKTDDTAAINKAISDGKRCGSNCNGSTTKNAVVYLPPGTYLVSTPLVILYGTQFIGDANNWPVIKAASSFVGLGVLSTDVYVGDGGGADGKDNEYYVNTASFYRQIRNMRIDVTATDPNAYVCAIHYQVAQATSLQFVELIAKSGTTQQGMFSENGSGGVLADITFTGGAFGYYGGNQQFTAQRLTFNGCDTAAQVIWDWGWTWKSVKVNNANVGFQLVPNDNAGGEDGNVGSAAFQDSVFTNVKKAIVIMPPSSKPGSGTTGLYLDNVAFSGVGVGVTDTNGNTILSGANGVQAWAMGPIYNDTTRTWSAGATKQLFPDVSLLGNLDGQEVSAPYFERAKPQYEGNSVGDFVHLKDLGAKGDGSTDDTAAVQAAFNNNVGKIIFADAGVYLLTDTVTIPAGTKIVGEAWTQFAATGGNFGDASHPRVMFKVGNNGDKGTMEMQDLMFTTKGPTPGAVLVEWNILADAQGSAGLWDCHARLGGATGTELTPAECPALTNGQVNAKCQVASLVMHITAGSSGYFENMWLWTADHMVDDPDLSSGKNEMTQLSVFAARGLLVESQDPVWLYGTSSEHAVLYQYNYNGAKHVFAGLVQTESPYYQPSPKAPNPFKDTLGVFNGDPDYSCAGNDFDGCDSSWGIIIQESNNVYVTSAGVYSFFDTYTQDCIDKHTCQKSLVLVQNNYDNVRIAQLITIGAKYMITNGEAGILATDNLAITTHPSWSQITLFDGSSSGAPPSYDFGPDEVEPCTSVKNYETLADLQNDVANIPRYCVPAYSMFNMYRMLQAALSNYTDLTTNGGYDDKYNAYVRWVKEQTPVQLRTFMLGDDAPGNKYFSCTLDENGKSTTTKPCKPGVDPNGVQYDPFYTITYTLEDHDGFFAELLDKYGISEDWVQFGEYDDQRHCGSRGCPNINRKYENFPIAADSYNVTNPKDFISSAYDGFQNLLQTIAGYQWQMLSGTFQGSDDDVMQVLVMPVSLAMSTVDAMNQVAAIGEKEEEAEKKQLILTILSAVLFVVPVVGEELGTATSAILATIGNIIRLLGFAGNTALSIYDIYKDPSSAPLAIMGILFDGAANFGRSVADMTRLGGLRRGMSAEDLGKLGRIFKENDDIVQGLVKFCRVG